MTPTEAIIELEDWLHERERERMGRSRGCWNAPYDARTDALRLAIRVLQDGEETGHGVR